MHLCGNLSETVDLEGFVGIYECDRHYGLFGPQGGFECSWHEFLHCILVVIITALREKDESSPVFHLGRHLLYTAHLLAHVIFVKAYASKETYELISKYHFGSLFIYYY